MKKKVIVALIILSLLILGIVICSKKTDKNHATLFGNIEIRTVDLGFEVDGRLEQMLKLEGDTVEKGDLLAELDDREYLALYNRSEAEISLNQAKLENATRELNRHTPLYKIGATSKEIYEKIEKDYEIAVSNLKIAEETSKIAKRNLDNTKIYAPNSGIITTRIQEEGAIVMPSAPAYTLSLSNPTWVRAYINEKNLGNIQYGQKVSILTDSKDYETGKNKEYVGYVGYISPVAEFTPKTVQTEDLRSDLVYRTRIYILEHDKFLRQGMPVTIKVDLKNIEVKKDLNINE